MRPWSASRSSPAGRINDALSMDLVPEGSRPFSNGGSRLVWSWRSYAACSSATGPTLMLDHLPSRHWAPRKRRSSASGLLCSLPAFVLLAALRTRLRPTGDARPPDLLRDQAGHGVLLRSRACRPDVQHTPLPLHAAKPPGRVIRIVGPLVLLGPQHQERRPDQTRSARAPCPEQQRGLVVVGRHQVRDRLGVARLEATVVPRRIRTPVMSPRPAMCSGPVESVRPSPGANCARNRCQDAQAPR